MKQKFLRILSCILAVCILMSALTIAPVFADSEDEAISDAKNDANFLLSIARAGDWYQACVTTNPNGDHLAWNYFHEEVIELPHGVFL